MLEPLTTALWYRLAVFMDTDGEILMLVIDVKTKNNGAWRLP